MVVVMGTDATSEQIDAVVARVADAGGDAFVSRGVSRTIIGLVGDVDEFGTPRPPWHAWRHRRRPDLVAVQAGESTEPSGDVDGVRR